MTKIVRTHRVYPEQLNDIYKKWVAPKLDRPVHNYSDDVNVVSMRYGFGKQFDEYVWESGGHIRQESGKRYAEFFKAEDLTMFILRHS